MAAAQILYKRVAGHDHCRGAMVAQMSHWPQRPLQLPVVGFNLVVAVPLAVVPGPRTELELGVHLRPVYDRLRRRSTRRAERLLEERPELRALSASPMRRRR